MDSLAAAGDLGEAGAGSPLSDLWTALTQGLPGLRGVGRALRSLAAGTFPQH